MTDRDGPPEEPARGGRRGEEGFGHAIVEHLAAPAPHGRQTADAVEGLPDGDGRETDAFGLDGIENGSDPRLGRRAQHLGNDIRLYRPRKRSGHSPPSPEKDRGFSPQWTGGGLSTP